MIVLIRAEATMESGSGHVMRCAALGMRLMARGAKVYFACTGLPGRLTAWLHDRGFELVELTVAVATDWRADLAEMLQAARQIGQVDLLVVDHYALGREWEAGMRPCARRILVVDDLADRDHDCDLLLDQNLHENLQNRYQKRVPLHAAQFLGPQYALLRSEFDKPGLERDRDGMVKQLLVFFGGTDPGNQTLKVIAALQSLKIPIPETTIVLGPAYPYRDAIHGQAGGLPGLCVLDATDRMAELMAQADLAIGTCGVAAWERCALGLPALVVVTAENQREDAEILHQLGAVENLGEADEVDAEDWKEALQRAIGNPPRIRAMGLAAGRVMAERKNALADLERALTDGLQG